MPWPIVTTSASSDSIATLPRPAPPGRWYGLGQSGKDFRYYTCSGCGNADIFVDVLPLAGESDEDFRRRRDDLEAAVKQLHGEGVGIVLVERP